MKSVGVFPALVTLANGYCGVLAIYKANDGHFSAAAMLILLAMVFDVLDGKVARITGVTSNFGAYLDSLSDAISFGVAPAFLAKAVCEGGIYAPKPLTLLTIVFALGALIRLARYNVEHASPEGSDKDGAVSMFRGIPTPGAAGVVASLVFLAYDEQALLDYRPAIRVVLPPLCMALACLMVSNVPYLHFGTRFLQVRREFSYFFVVVVLLALIVRFPEECAAIGFVSYGLSGPVMLLFRRREARGAGPPEDSESESEPEVSIPDGL